MPDLPVLSAGVFVLALSGVVLAGALLDVAREVIILAAAALIGVGVFLVRRGLRPVPWEIVQEAARVARKRNGD